MAEHALSGAEHAQATGPVISTTLLSRLSGARRSGPASERSSTLRRSISPMSRSGAKNKMWDRFERLRKEDPVHYTPDSVFGPYWSITRHRDIIAVDSDYKRFSSDADHGGITLGNMTQSLVGRSFITADEPIHSEQRKTAQPAVAPTALKDYEPLIRKTHASGS